MQDLSPTHDVHDAAAPDGGQRARLRDYVAIARPDHWVKHVFIVPGIIVAWLLTDASLPAHLGDIVIGLVSACLLSSANYVLNEWLDAEFDRHHPIKRQRPAVARRLSGRLVYGEYALCAAVGLALASRVSPLFLITAILFLISGLTYNIRPLRTKNRAYLDVISEAVNNPIRLLLGWSMIEASVLPPTSLIIAYWMGGAYLMAMKRFAEYRSVVATAGAEALVRYRQSFAGYTEEKLIVSSFVYALLSCFFLGVFLIKYRVEYILMFPPIALLFAAYLQIGLRPTSVAQTPELLHKERGLLALVAVIAVLFILLSFIDLPAMKFLVTHQFDAFRLP